MAMLTVEIVVRKGSAIWWWCEVKRRMDSGLLPEEEVIAALCALIAEARSLPGAPVNEVEAKPGALWSEVLYCCREGWLHTDMVIRYFSHLLELKRYLPMPQRALSDCRMPARRVERKQRYGGVPL